MKERNVKPSHLQRNVLSLHEILVPHLELVDSLLLRVRPLLVDQRLQPVEIGDHKGLGRELREN